MPGRPHKIRSALKNARSKLKNFFSRRIGSGEKRETQSPKDDSTATGKEKVYVAEAQRLKREKKPPLESEPA